MEKLAIVGEMFRVPDEREDEWWAWVWAVCPCPGPTMQLLRLILQRLACCGTPRVGEGGDGGADRSPRRSCMVSSSMSNDMFCGTFGNTDDVVLARRRRGRGATIVTGAGESPREGDAARDDWGLRSTAGVASPFVWACERERWIVGRRGAANGEGNSTGRSWGDLGNVPGGGARGGNTPEANRCIWVRIPSSSSSSSRMRSRSWRFSSRSVLVVLCESESAESSASVSTSCFSFISCSAAC